MDEKLWSSGEAYEAYVGRWSRLVAGEFVAWLDVAAGAEWLDVGCGTGALAETVLESAAPARVTGVDPSSAFIDAARERLAGRPVSLLVGDAQSLPLADESFDAAVSGLVLNFVPEPGTAVGEMSRVTRPGGTVGAYVWDYSDGMQLMRYFWDAAIAIDERALELDEGRKFGICRPEPLAALARDAGLADVDVRPIDVPTKFADFDDYWTPFLGGVGPGPAFASALAEEQRSALRERLRAALPKAADGSIELTARAWAVRGRRP